MHVTAVEEQPRSPVALDVVLAESLGQQAKPRASPQVELKQPFARRIEALRKEDVLRGRRVQMRHAQ